MSGTASELRKELLAAAARAAAAPCSTVLIEAGAGAPVAALVREIHTRSPRSGRPLVTVEHGPRSAVELSESLAAAGQGTLFLERVERAPTGVQAELARALELRRGEPATLGPRVVASVCGAAEQLARDGALREDLLYRLNGLALRIEPLRTRPEDIAVLARAELARRAPQLELTRAAERRLREHDWPANERELELVIERAALVARGRWVEEADLGLAAAQPPRGGPELAIEERSLRAVEELVIRRVLDEQGGNRSAAARVLGLHRATLHHKLRALGLRTR